MTYQIDTRDTEIDFAVDELGENERIIQNAKNLLMTRRGEVPFDRMRGLDPALFDLPVAEAGRYLKQEVDRVLAWEPRCKAVGCRIFVDDENESVISVEIEVGT